LFFLNSDDFYADLKVQFNKMQQEGFLADRDGDHSGGLADLTYFADTPEDAMSYVERQLRGMKHVAMGP
jgi:hypothetical protein